MINLEKIVEIKNFCCVEKRLKIFVVINRLKNIINNYDDKRVKKC